MPLIETQLLTKPEFNVTVKKQDGGSYQAFRVVHKDSSGQVKSIEKPMAALKFNKNLQKQLESVDANQFVTIHMEKNAAGFLEMQSITAAGAAPTLQANEQVATGQSTPKAASTSFQSTGRDFETKEERTQKQLLIVRQSSLSSAIALRPKGDALEVIALAEKFVDFVFNGQPQEQKPYGTKVPVVSKVIPVDGDFEDDIPQ